MRLDRSKGTKDFAPNPFKYETDISISYLVSSAISMVENLPEEFWNNTVGNIEENISNFFRITEDACDSLTRNILGRKMFDRMDPNVKMPYVTDSAGHEATVGDIKNARLIITHQAFQTVENWYDETDSWLVFYDNRSWAGAGLLHYGLKDYGKWSVDNKTGLKFGDGSFAVGIKGRNYGDDGAELVRNSWVWAYNEDSSTDWSNNYYGFAFFDKNGRPAVVIMSNAKTGSLISEGYSFIYEMPGKWTYSSDDNWHKSKFNYEKARVSTLSLAHNALRFNRNNNKLKWHT